MIKGADSTDGAQSLKPGNPIALIAEAEELGGGDAAHAVVARIRPDLLTVDLDGCADVIQSGVLDAAERVGAPLVYLAASGSPNSVHMVFAPATAWARTHLRSQIDEIRTWAGYDTRAVDVLTPARYLRLPGSASLKLGGEFCRPIDVDGTPLSAAAAAARARAALVSINPSTRRDVGDTTPPASERRLQPTNVGIDAVTATGIVRTSPEDASPAVVTDIAPRAWRRRKRFTYADWRILMSHPPVGTRSDRATEAAWRLWQSGIRDWSISGWYYRNCVVFEKFTGRDSTAPGSSRAHWESIATRARAHRPPLSSAERGVIDRVRERMCSWTDRPAQAIAMLAILEHRFTDGHGLTDRPIAVRDLMSWLNVASIGTAKALLDGLVEQRALAVSTPYAQTAPREASRYSLVDPEVVLSQSYPEHDVTILCTPTPPPSPLTPTVGEPLSPLWGLLGADCWRVYSHLLASSTPLASAVLASEVDLPVGTRRYGCLRLLDALVAAQLVERTDRGRRTKWVALAGDAVRRAEEATGALVRLKALRTRINAERAAWHAETRTEHRRAQRVLRRILDGLRERSPKRQLELEFEVGEEFSAASVATARPTVRTKRGRHMRPPGRPSGRGSP